MKKKYTLEQAAKILFKRLIQKERLKEAFKNRIIYGKSPMKSIIDSLLLEPKSKRNKK